MRAKHCHVISACATLSQTHSVFSMSDLVAHLVALGADQEHAHIRALVMEAEKEGVLSVFQNRGLWIRYYKPEVREAWARADALAQVLGGKSNHYVSGTEATVELTLEQAQALVERLSSLRREVNLQRAHRTGLLPLCWHYKVLMDWSGEELAPACGCRLTEVVG